MAMTLEPTMWRTCRILTHPVRLRMLGMLLAEGECCVSAMAASLRIPDSTATQHLRLLQSRGLIRGRRSSRWVRYTPKPDVSVGHARDMLNAVGAALARQETFESIRQALTAFTHPRRIAIVRALRSCAKDAASLRHECGMSDPALDRHLRKLRQRGLVEHADDGWRLSRTDNLLALDLLRIAAGPLTPLKV